MEGGPSPVIADRFSQPIYYASQNPHYLKQERNSNFDTFEGALGKYQQPGLHYSAQEQVFKQAESEAFVISAHEKKAQNIVQMIKDQLTQDQEKLMNSHASS